MLKAEHITKQYQIPGGGHTVFDAVSDVSIELGNGGVTAIVGESGSGKSTLCSTISLYSTSNCGQPYAFKRRGAVFCGKNDGAKRGKR